MLTSNQAPARAGLCSRRPVKGRNFSEGSTNTKALETEQPSAEALLKENLMLKRNNLKLARLLKFYKERYTTAEKEREEAHEIAKQMSERNRIMLLQLQRTEEKLIDLEGVARLNKAGNGLIELEFKLAEARCDLAEVQHEKVRTIIID